MQNTARYENNNCAGGLAGKKIVLGVTGSIAAYKAAYIASALVQRGADVHVVMTQHAAELVGPATFWSLTKNPVSIDMFEPPARPEITHVSLPESADLFVIAPATANIIGKIANGIADDMLSTMVMVARCPIIIAPAMNVNMYTNPIVAGNMDKLKQYNYKIVEAEPGMLACGYEGVGRLADPEVIVSVIEETLLGGKRDLAGRNIVVTAGPTQEPIDPVRFISNRSSGKMGYAIAEAAAARGARVTLISGPADLQVPAGVEMVRVRTVQDMHDAVMGNIGDADVFISAAAPADFTPSKTEDQKIKKKDKLILELDKTVDILEKVGRQKEDKILVGFAAETTNLYDNAKAKLEKKNLDLIVANDVSPGSDVFGSDSNQVTLISKTGDRVEWPRMSKKEVANAVLDYIKKNFMEESV